MRRRPWRTSWNAGPSVVCVRGVENVGGGSLWKGYMCAVACMDMDSTYGYMYDLYGYISLFLQERASTLPLTPLTPPPQRVTAYC